MVLFTKLYGELSSRFQQSLRGCNNHTAHFKRMQETKHQKAARPDQRDAQRELVELSKFDTNTFSNSVLIFPGLLCNLGSHPINRLGQAATPA